MKIIIRLKGGSGSGNFGHEGIPGHVGGSAADGGSGADTEARNNKIQSDMYSAKHSLKKKYPANSGDELTIKAAKTVSKKYKMRFQDILKLYTPSSNIIGSRSWDNNGKIIIVR